jgi:hypothetical protein
MKKLILIIILISSGLMATAQIYYDPGESIDINITVKEPFKPINYAEIGQDFTNAMQKEVARRNALKIYYDDIAYETKNSVYSNSILTNDYLIDNIIFKLQKKQAEDFILKLNKSNFYDAPIVTEITLFDIFYNAEENHQNYYNQNSEQSYCDYTITPKIEKIKAIFSDKLK